MEPPLSKIIDASLMKASTKMIPHVISGISVSNTPGAVDASTASTAIYLLLGALRRSHIPGSALRAGKWRGHMQLAHDPENKMLGILGMGGIGSATAKRAMGFGMTIQYHNRRQLPPEKNPFNAKYVGFEELLRTSDVISVHLPLNDGTRGMIGRREFGLMKPGVTFVNTARGPIVDEQALVEALESDHVWGAGLDVFDQEPIVHEGLLRNDHCVLMPHVGTATFNTQLKMEVLVIENLKAAITEGRQVTPVIETRNMLTSTGNNGVLADKLSSHEAEAHSVINGINGTNGLTGSGHLLDAGDHRDRPDHKANSSPIDQSGPLPLGVSPYLSGTDSSLIKTVQMGEQLTKHSEVVQEESIPLSSKVVDGDVNHSDKLTP